MTLNPLELYDLLVERVSESDLKTIVFRLRIRYENLAGAILSEKILSLIQYFEDRNRSSDLLEAICQVRSDLRGALSITAPVASALVQRPDSPLPQSHPNADTQMFDVFLAHNSQDKPQVEYLANLLRARGIRPWLDKDQIAPGSWFQDAIQAVLPNVKSAAIIIGPGSLGRWQKLEIRTFVSQCVENSKPVIPVLLPGVKTLPDTLLFLKELQFVQFQRTIDESSALGNLIWGISGKRPSSA
jgi:hypothetical protein